MRIIVYLRDTKTQGIIMRKPTTQPRPQKLRITAYADANFGMGFKVGDDIANSSRRAITGAVMFVNNTLMEYFAKRQPTTSMNTAEAEYIALSFTASHIIFYRQVLESFNLLEDGPSTLNGDNTASISIANNDMIHSRVKHLDVKLHFIRELINMKHVRVVHISTEHQLGDLLTKALAPARFEKLRNKILCLL